MGNSTLAWAAKKKRLVLTGGTYNVFSDDMLATSELMVELVLVEFDAMDTLLFFPGDVC